MAYAFGFVLYVRIAQAIFAGIGLALAGYGSQDLNLSFMVPANIS